MYTKATSSSNHATPFASKLHPGGTLIVMTGNHIRLVWVYRPNPDLVIMRLVTWWGQGACSVWEQLWCHLAQAAADTDGLISLSDQDRGGKCQGKGQECVIITSRGDLLELLSLVRSCFFTAEFAVTFLLFQVKTGKQKAQEQLVFSHCLFTGPLPIGFLWLGET